tara:strand:- start:53 stop:283 length:231 start_codon:yes stop_codon:yes gene_type:complete
MTEDNTNVISINGTDHDVNSMSNEQKHIINQIKVCQAKANNLKAELQIFEVSLQGFTNALIKSVEVEEVVEEEVAN